MDKNTLFERAFAIRAAKPWEHMLDTQLFAVRFSDGELACCSVMGRNGNHLALALYSPTDGMYALDKIMTEDVRLMPRHRAQEMMMSQDCIQVSFENARDIPTEEADAIRTYAKAHSISLRGQHKFPVFRRYRPTYFPQALTDETEQQHLLEAMDALLEVSRRLSTEAPLDLGLIEGDPFTHPIPLLTATPDGWCWESYMLKKPDAPVFPAGKIEDELALTRLKKRKKPCSPWALAVFMYPVPVQPSPDETAYFPYSLCAVNTSSGEGLLLAAPRRIDEYAPYFSADLLQQLQRHGRPSKFWAADDRTTAFITPIAEQLGIPVDVQEEMPPMDELLDELYSQADTITCGLPDEDTDEMPDEAEMLKTLAAKPEALGMLPDSMLMTIRDALDEIPGSEAAQRAVDEELARRHLLPHQ